MNPSNKKPLTSDQQAANVVRAELLRRGWKTADLAGRIGVSADSATNIIIVTGNGITLRFGKQVYNYKNETTGRLRGQRVISWFDPDLPEILTVTDMQRKNAFCVHRSQEVPAMDAPPEILEQELARNEAHQKYSKTRYRILKSNSVHLYRPNLVSAQTAELGRVIESSKVEAKKESQLQTRARKSFGKLGALVPSRARPETIDAADELAKMLNEKDDQ